MSAEPITACPECGMESSENYGGTGMCWACWNKNEPEAKADAKPATGAPAPEITVVPLEEFVAVDEPGADPLIGSPGAIFIPEGGDVMFYGDGGAGKTTLEVDQAFHLAAGDDWLGMPIRRAVPVLLVENEGPRPLFRDKLRRKHRSWAGSPLDGRLRIMERPWGEFTFATQEWRATLAAAIKEQRIEVLIAGPLNRLGMNAAGTLQEVNAFMDYVRDVREQLPEDHRLTVQLIHHENKGGAVSGAWEGAGDTLVHVQAAGNGHTIAFLQKARWDSSSHGTTLKLAWIPGDGFELEGDRDYLAQIVELLSDDEWRTIDEIRRQLQAGKNEIEQVIKTDHPDRFQMCTGEYAKALGRSSNAHLYQLAQV